MLRTTILFLALMLTVAQRFEPARVATAQVGEIPYRTAAAAVVGVELTVDSRGSVTNVRDLVDVEPFTEVLRTAASRWTFNPARDGGQRVDTHVLVAGVLPTRDVDVS